MSLHPKRPVQCCTHCSVKPFEGVGWDALNLDLCPALETVSFVVVYGYYVGYHLGDSCYGAVAKILEQVTPTVREVTIRFIPVLEECNAFGFEESIGIPSIRRIFMQRAAFPRLRAVVLHLQCRTLLELHCRTLEEALPELHKSGMLRIDVVSVAFIEDNWCTF